MYHLVKGKGSSLVELTFKVGKGSSLVEVTFKVGMVRGHHL